MTITDDMLDRWKKITDAATVPKWTVPAFDKAEITRKTRVYGYHSFPCFTLEDGVSGARQIVPATMGDVPDCEFIALARTAMPALIAEVRRLRKIFGIEVNNERPNCPPL